MNWREVKKEHKVIDLQRPIVDDKMRYQVLCYCGRRSLIGGRAETYADQKEHRREVWRESNRQDS